MAPTSYDTRQDDSGLDEVLGARGELGCDDFDDIERELWCSTREAGLSFPAVFEDMALQ